MAQSVSEGIRGFSFMPENKVDDIDLQYIEGGELSRAWKMSRRERLKSIEAKIWEEFINERDVVDSVRSDDPYQFIEQLPDDCLRELMDTELMNLKAQMHGDAPVDQPKQQEFKEALQEPRDTMVTFAQEEDESCDMIGIMDDDDEVCEGEREEVNESLESPCTVREKQHSSPSLSPKSPNNEPAVTTRTKSPENVTSMIETSIYSAKVKELQSKVNLELLAVITTLEVQNLNRIDPNMLPKLQKQCTEFCARYCRIYLYPLSRQIHDITRHNNAALPFARHTHIRSQMIRTVSLQQNMLQSIQVFLKWFSQKTPLRECVYSLKNLIQLLRDADAVCPVEVHNEELLQTCESLNEALSQYMGKLTLFIKDENATNASLSRSGKSSKPTYKKRSWKQGTNSKPEADAKLSMYSLDRFHLNSKATSVGRSSGGTSKARVADSANPAKLENADPAPKKTYRSRRPLMRAPGGMLRRERPGEVDNISTLVESVDVTVSARASATCSARSRDTPHAPHAPLTPRRLTVAKHKGKGKDTSPRRSPTKSKQSTKRSEKEFELALNSVHGSDDTLPSVIKVQCAKKDSPVARPDPDADQLPDRSPDKSEDAAKKEKKDGPDAQKELVSTSDVSALLRKLCAGQSARSRGQKERASGSKNAQLLCINGGSPRQPALGTPQLLRILEETIQKQAPKPQFCNKPLVKDVDRYRLNFNTTSKASDALFHYRTKFVQHMLSSPMYANNAVGKPWEMIGNVSEKIIDEILLACAKEFEMEKIVDELYKAETK